MSNLEQQITLAQQYLQPYTTNPLGHFIKGQFCVPNNNELFDNTSPVDNQSLGQIVNGTVTDVDMACQASWEGFKKWSQYSGAERKKILHRLADLITKRAEEIALIESMDCGQPIRFMKQAAVRGAANFRFFADKATEAENGDALYQLDHINITMRSPIGPVAIITPWNTPFMLSTWKIAPALAAGCSIVHKPAELSPLTASILAEVSAEAGLPDGVWNMVNGKGETTGKTLTEHPLIQAVAFVGESHTGRQIMRQGSNTLKRVHFELGGKNPVIVFDDADFDRALDAVVFMIYSLNGQRCTSSSRLIIQSGIKEKFEAALIQRVKSLKVGHPLDSTTEVGPLIHTTHFDKIMSYMAIAEQDGATIAVGGGRYTDLPQGNYIQPTLFTDADNQMRIAREEIFGPVLTSIEFTDEDDAIAIANDSDYGLSAYAWTNDTSRSMRLAKKINTGMLWINSENNRNLPSPFGGIKQSGIGRDGGDYSFEFYMETKNVCIAQGTHKVPKLGITASS